MRKSKKLISLLLAALMLMSCFTCLASVTAFAAEGETESTTLIGDVDKNGRVDITDATIIQLYVAKVQDALDKFESGEYDLAAADVDGSGVIDITDATLIQLQIAHIEIPTEEPTTEGPTEPVETTEPIETTEAPSTEAPTTEEPTEESTTEAPTTEAPTTEAPTTEEPTEAPTTEPVVAPVYTIVGSSTSVFTSKWDPTIAGNDMNLQEDGTYQLVLEDVGMSILFPVEAKVAVNHSMDTTYGDVKFRVLLPCDVTFTFDPATGVLTVDGRFVIGGSVDPVEPTTEAPTTEEPTEEPTTEAPTTEEPTEAPTTEEPTTEAPTTEEPTTEAATTEEPTTEAPTTEPAEAEYVLAGTTNWLTTGWDAENSIYVMTPGKDGAPYTITVGGVVAAPGIYGLKVVDRTTGTWYGMDGTDLNVDFSLTTDCDVTVTFNPETGEITVSGDGVVAPEYDIDAIYAVGESGGTAFLNGVSWNPEAADNEMAEVEDGVYEITFEEVDTNTAYQFKFAANGSWDMNWGFGPAGGTTEIEVNAPSEATYNGGNAMFEVVSVEDTCDVTLRLDLTNWDPAKKGGAIITVIVEGYEPPTEEPTTEAPTTEEPTTEAAPTEEPTTEAPTTEEPTTEAPTTEEPATEAPTTEEPTTEAPTTEEPTTEAPTTEAPTTEAPTTEEPTTEAPTTEEPTTEAPTTEEPTTEAPTTEEPTTEAPTTEEPTTEAPTTEPASAENVFVLAGTTNWLSCGWTAADSAYVMTKGEDGIYSITVPEVVAAEGIYGFKVVEFPADGSEAVWHGMDGTDLNVDFSMTADCDVTVTYNPETGEITVTGDGVIAPQYDIQFITAVGESGGTAFLNGQSWNPAAEANKMKEIEPGVYEIIFTEVETNTDYQFKFAANGNWDMNWGYGAAGGTEEIELDTPCEATYNGGNAKFMVESEWEECEVILRLDLSNWDSQKKTGAMITVEPVFDGAPPEPEPGLDL